MRFEGPFSAVIKIQLVPDHKFLKKKVPGEFMDYEVDYEVEVMGIILSHIEVTSINSSLHYTRILTSVECNSEYYFDPFQYFNGTLGAKLKKI